jgi:hypothetical protein
MNISSLTGISGNFLQSTLANQLTSNTLTGASHASKNGQPSAFAQLLSDASAGTASSKSTAGNAGQLLNQLVSNFQASGIQSQGQSLDPSSIGA